MQLRPVYTKQETNIFLNNKKSPSLNISRYFSSHFPRSFASLQQPEDQKKEEESRTVMADEQDNIIVVDHEETPERLAPSHLAIHIQNNFSNSMYVQRPLLIE